VKDHRRAGLPSPHPAAIGRRLVTIPVSWLVFALSVLLAPLAALVALVTDVSLRREGRPTVRMVGFVVLALWIEVSSHPRILWSWLSQPFARASWTERNNDLMHWWAGRLTRGAERVVGVRWRFDIPDELGPGPLVAFCQHVSIVDAIAPVYILGNHKGWYLRYTLTRGLRFDPCLDIVGHRIPNHFVARGGGGDTAGLDHLRTLVTDMEGDECATIFPGGGLFTPEVLARAVEKLVERGSPQAQAATAYRHVLPPRPGGVNAFLDGAPDAHVLIVGHIGFEPLASIRRLWSVLPLAEPVEVKVWRYDRSEVPENEEDRMAWLYDKWQVMDDWIDARMRARADDATVPA
jgi:hypothetical protein